MTDTLASSAAPPQALKLWTDGHSIFIEIPGRAGPYIMARDYDLRAISYVFSLLGATHIEYKFENKVPDNYLKPSKAPGTHNQRELAEQLLRARGIIK